MGLTELLNICALSFALFVAILFFNLLLRRTVKSAARGLFFKIGIFVLFSALNLLLPLLLAHLDKTLFSFGIKATVECLWWFSLNFLANEVLTYFIWDRLLPKKGVTASKLLRDLVSFILVIATIAFIFNFVFEKSVVGLFTASGVMAIILGYSAQATLGEAFAGVGLNITKQFDQGDWIGVSGSYGQVVDINWRFVSLLTLDGNYISIPNSQITKANIINYSLPDPLHGISIRVPVKATISPEAVKKMLTSAAAQSFKIAREPSPRVSLIDMQLNNNLFQLIYHTTEPSAETVTDEILSIFWYQCQRAEAAASASSNLLTSTYSKEDLQVFLQKMDLFSSLTPEEVEQLAEQCAYRVYGPPEQLLAQGQANQSLFLIYKGSVDVYIKTPNDQMTKVATLNEGQYFGEMSLLTGDPAGASIVAATEIIIIEVTHSSMAKLFEQRPELVEKISTVVVMRKLHNENVRASLSNANKNEKQSLISQLTNRIKNFFKKTSTEKGEQ